MVELLLRLVYLVSAAGAVGLALWILITVVFGLELNTWCGAVGLISIMIAIPCGITSGLMARRRRENSY